MPRNIEQRQNYERKNVSSERSIINVRNKNSQRQAPPSGKRQKHHFRKVDKRTIND